jgi:hypothetical protein
MATLIFRYSAIYIGYDKSDGYPGSMLSFTLIGYLLSFTLIGYLLVWTAPDGINRARMRSL